MSKEKNYKKKRDGKKEGGEMCYQNPDGTYSDKELHEELLGEDKHSIADTDSGLWSLIQDGYSYEWIKSRYKQDLNKERYERVKKMKEEPIEDFEWPSD